MNQKKLALWLKAIIIGVGICGTIIYFGILPNLGSFMNDTYPEFSSWHWPWMIFLWCTAIPCYIVLVLGWKLANNIGADRSFSTENAELLQSVAEYIDSEHEESLYKIAALRDAGFSKEELSQLGFEKADIEDVFAEPRS